MDCKACQSNNTVIVDNGVYCKTCTLYSRVKLGMRKTTNKNNYANKTAHFKNIIKKLNNTTQQEDCSSENVIQVISEKYGHIDIDANLLSQLYKKENIKDKKNYITHNYILNKLKGTSTKLDKQIINNVNYIFHDYIDYLYKTNNITHTISYKLILYNVLELFDIQNHFSNMNNNNPKDKKFDLWNKYVAHVCNTVDDDRQTVIKFNLSNHFTMNKPPPPEYWLVVH